VSRLFADPQPGGAVIGDAKDSSQLQFGIARFLRYIECFDSVFDQSAVWAQNTDLEVTFLGCPPTTIELVAGGDAVPCHPLCPYLYHMIDSRFHMRCVSRRVA